MIVNLVCKPSPDCDLPGFNYYIQYGRAFNAKDYAGFYSLNAFDFSFQNLLGIQEAVSKLNPGEYLGIKHEAYQESDFGLNTNVEPVIERFLEQLRQASVSDREALLGLLRHCLDADYGHDEVGFMLRGHKPS